MARWTEEHVKCDTCGAREAKRVKTSVVFTTEQTEGRPTEPYIQIHELDVCDDCLEQMVGNGRQIYAHGAQGYNTYYFKPTTNNKEG